MTKITLMTAAAAAAVVLGAGSARAQVWMPMIERQALLEERIDARLHAGDITIPEARGLRADMAALVRLEARYRWGGLSARERLDLDRRYALIDDQARVAVGPPLAGPTLASLEERKLDLDARIDAGVRLGQLTPAEADTLRDDFDAIAATEAAYRVDGLSPGERADLARRFDDLSVRIRVARADGDRVYGLNRY